MSIPILCGRNFFSLSAFGGEGRGEVVLLLPFPLSHLLPFLLLILLSSPSTPAAVFTTNLTLSETNFAYDGQDIVIDGATVAIDGPHAFNSLLLSNGAVLTIPPTLNLTAPIAPTPPEFARTLRA